MLKVSVIIPVYNAEQYLVDCIDSVLGQTFTNLQIICIDDGSVDNSAMILDSYAKKDKRLVVVHKKNAGVSAARNDGIKIANGDYIHFMDADDWIDKDYYEKLLNNVNNDVDIICSGFMAYKPGTRSIIYKYNYQVCNLFKILFWTQALTDSYVWRYLFKTKLIYVNKLLFDVDLVSQEDACFVLNAIALAKCVNIIAGPVYNYRYNDESALNNKSNQKIMQKHYEIGENFRKEYSKCHNVYILWYFRETVKKIFNYGVKICFKKYQ